MLDYCCGLVARTLWQLWNLFGVVFLLAWLLQLLSERIRSHGFSRFGDVYWYFVAPGVACHESGHALGCLMTGVQIGKFVPFCRKDGLLGYVRHEAPSGWFGPIASFIIATGPIWFGSAAILLLTSLFADGVPELSWRANFETSALPGLVEYGLGVMGAAVGFIFALFGEAHWGIGFIIWLYLSFCIASEIGLSVIDMKHIRPGLVRIVCVAFALNIIPSIGRGISVGIYAMMPCLFKVHVLMLVALVINLAIYIVFNVLKTDCRFQS